MRRKLSRRKIIPLILIIGTFSIILSLQHAVLQNKIDDDDYGEYDLNVNYQIDNYTDFEKKETLTMFYNDAEDWHYHYEFRLERHPLAHNGTHRLMLVLYGAKRACDDMWDFSVGERILKAFFSYGYSILTICSRKETYDINVPVSMNNDAKYIYLSLQKWLNTVYYVRFRQYPLLYIHATSRGSKFAGILCRVLPIQAQILYTFPGHREAMSIPSAYNDEMQQNLVFNSTYANWFYFDFCYKPARIYSSEIELCPFYSQENYFYPIPPTVFTYLRQDPYQREDHYRFFVQAITENARELGGILLTHEPTLKWFVLEPANFYPTYMQQNFYPWREKPHAAQLFYEHLTHPGRYKPTSRERRTCWCIEIDFKYYERMPSITLRWTQKKIQEYSDYIRDIRKYENAFCEEVCGDLLTTHSMVSRDIRRTLNWVNEIDRLRKSINPLIENKL